MLNYIEFKRINDKLGLQFIDSEMNEIFSTIDEFKRRFVSFQEIQVKLNINQKQ